MASSTAETTIKTAVKREAGRWFVCVNVEISEPEPLSACDQIVGCIDVGLATFAVLSCGVGWRKFLHRLRPIATRADRG